jgi:hypothetical protein
VSRNLPAHVAYRRPAEVVPSQRRVPVRGLAADARPVSLPPLIRWMSRHRRDLIVLLKVYGICLAIAFPAGLFVWLVTQ